jgi:hypothetical protein
LVLACTCARADVGVVLNDSLNTSIARITGSGHSAIYFSRICPDSPIKLRLCHPDESGSSISNYTDQPFEWNIAPLNVYLYGGTSAEDRPLFATSWRTLKAYFQAPRTAANPCPNSKRIGRFCRLLALGSLSPSPNVDSLRATGLFLACFLTEEQPSTISTKAWNFSPV